MAPIINFVDGKLDLVCSIRYDASEADIELWKNSIIHASKILLHATDNQVQFGKLTIHNKSTGGYFANAFLHENCGRSTTGVRVHLCRDEQSSPFTIIHELGHHVFKLHDEYMNDSEILGSSYCSGHADTQRCIMEFGRDFGDQINLETGEVTNLPVREFCSGENHHTGEPVNLQQLHCEKSCWEAILELPLFGGLSVPAAERVFGPDAYEEITWITSTRYDRLLIILDLSPVLSGTPALEGITNAVRLLIDFYSILHQWLGIESGAGSHQPVYVLQPIDSKAKRIEAVQAVKNASSNALPFTNRALSQAAQRYKSIGNQAASQSVLLFRVGPPGEVQTDALTTAFRNHGVRFNAIVTDAGFPFAQQERLAAETAGLLEYLPGIPQQPEMTHAIQNTTATMLAELIDNGGLLFRKTYSIPASAPAGPPADRGKSSAPEPVGPETEADQTVLVEKFCDRVTFVLNRAGNVRTDFKILTPNGEMIVAGNDNRIRFFDNVESRYALYSIVNPTAGIWTMRALRGDLTDNRPIRVTTIAMSQNARLSLDVELKQVPKTNSFQFWISVWYGTLVENLEPPVIEVFRTVLGESPDPLVIAKTVGNFHRPSARNRDVMFSHCEGVYGGQIDLPGPGSYTVVMRISNKGTATPSDTCYDSETARPNEVPLFFREVRRHITVS